MNNYWCDGSGVTGTFPVCFVASTAIFQIGDSGICERGNSMMQ